MTSRTVTPLLCATMLILPAAVAGESKVDNHVKAFSNLLGKHPKMVIDLSAHSGEYCMNTWKVGGGHMTHYAIDPTKTREDVIEFVRVQSLGNSVSVSGMPKMPSKLGKMEPNVWYHLPAGAYEPHHGTRFSFDMIVRATDIQ